MGRVLEMNCSCGYYSLYCHNTVHMNNLFFCFLFVQIPDQLGKRGKEKEDIKIWMFDEEK